MSASQANGAGASDDADFTPNPQRAIWIEGRLDEALLERLRPQIVELTAQSREPITVFINSRGGIAEVGQRILDLLRTNQGGAGACKIITAASPRAESAAADLLSAGDLAIAYPSSTLLWHGVRWPLSDLVSAGEAGRLYAQTLPVFHEKNAAVLALNSVRRFLFIVSALRPTFEQHRAEANDPKLSDLDCFQAILRGKLSPAAQQVLERAIPLWKNYNGLLLQFQKRLPRGRSVSKEHLRKLMLYSAFDFEYEKGERPDWDAGLGRISDHFHFLNSFFDFGALCDHVAGRPGPQSPETEAEALLQFRQFFLALYRALQEGENQITPVDAVWLGLIDSVR